MAKDATDREISLGDTVMLARTGKSAGISWYRLKVTRLTDKSFWSEITRNDLSTYERGPYRPGNCVVIESRGSE